MKAKDLIEMKRLRIALWEHFPLCRFARWAVPKLSDWLRS